MEWGDNKHAQYVCCQVSMVAGSDWNVLNASILLDAFNKQHREPLILE